MFLTFIKHCIVVFVFSGLAGYALDIQTVFLSNEETKIKRKDSWKRLLNIIVYGTGGSLFYWFTMIPASHDIRFLPLFMLIGGIIFTLTELGYGMLFNVLLKLNVWNYTTKINFKGQIDLIHGLLWILLSFPVIYIDKAITFLMR